MPKVTVIMPSLNVVKYIRLCVESVLAQTLQDIEILAIDAGSTDGTKEILEEYACKDERLKLIQSDRKSYGYQVNKGIELAQGDYVGIVETDDRITPDMFEVLYESAVRTGVDYVKGTAQQFLEATSEIVIKNKIIGTSNPDDMGRILSPCEKPDLFVTDRFLWMGIYKADLIKRIKLNETPGAAYQDIGFLFQVISKAVSAIYLDHDVYFYRQDNQSASSYDAKAFSYLVKEYTYVRQFLEGKEKKWYQAYYQKMLYQCLGRFQIMAVSGAFWEQAETDITVLQTWFAEAVKKDWLDKEYVEEESWRKLQLLFESPRALYEEYREAYWKKVEYIKSIFRFINDRQVVVVGAGRYGQFFHALAESKYPGRVTVYCDNNEKLWNTIQQGACVLPPDEAVMKYPEAVYVIANSRNAEELKDQLRRLGVADMQICLCQMKANLHLFNTLQG